MESNIARHERLLRGEQVESNHETGPDVIMEGEETVETDAPIGSDAPETTADTPPEELAQPPPMDVDDPISPINAADDAVLSGDAETGVEADMAMLRVDSTPERQEEGEGGAPS